MTRLGALGVLLFSTVAVLGLWFWHERASPRLTLTEALVQAGLPGSACSEMGTLSGAGSFNESSHTWWLDWVPASSYAKPGCNPACVVNATSRAVEINWRCTGAIVPAAKDDLITVTAPLPGEIIESPLSVRGEARGNWYFEAQFPVMVYDANGKLLGSAPAHASGDWMTTNYVPFSATVTFLPSGTATGTLVLKKDNPSGLPQNANQLVLPVSFTAPASFEASGNLTHGNPGQKPDAWYLVYDEPSAPGRFVELDFSTLPSAPTLVVGARVRGVGTLSGSVVSVRSITPSDSSSMNVQLFYYNPALDQGPGGAQCSRTGLVAVDRTISRTSTPLADSIRLLIQGKLSDAEKTQGLTTEFPLPGVSLTSATIVNGVATLTFADPQNRTSGGSCRTAVLWAQIEATATQFPSVHSVVFKPETLFQP